MMKSNLKNTALTLLWILISIPLFSQSYIDYKIRTDDFYAKTDESGFGDFSYADPSWHFRGKVSSSSGSGSYPAYECVYLTNVSQYGAWNQGKWYPRNTIEVWSGTSLDNADNIYINIEGWEEQTSSPCTMNTNDDYKSSDTDYDTDISGSHTRNYWTNFQRDNGSDDFVDCGTIGNQGYYKIEFDVWWNYSKPVNPAFSITNITSSSLTINLTDKKQYRITDWDYEVSTNSTFTNIVASATEIVPLTTDVTSGLTQNTTYYIKIRGKNEAGTGVYTSYQTMTTYGIKTWDGSENSDWNTAGNWDVNILPTIDDDVVIANVGIAPIIISGVQTDCKDLTIDSDATLTLEDGGSLKITGSVTQNGTFNVEKDLLFDRWYLISSPVTNALSGIFEGHFLQKWNESSGLWSDVSSLTEQLTPTKGFGFYGQLSEKPSGDTFIFTGTPNTGNQSPAVSWTNVAEYGFDGANLLGNPYTSSIDWSQLDDDWGAVYYFDANLGAEGDYASWNDGVAVDGGTQFIAPMQGFIIVVDEVDDGTTVNFTAANQSHSGATNYFKNKSETENSIRLMTSYEDYNTEMVIKFNEIASSGFDKEYDAYRFSNNSTGASQIYSLVDGIKMAIDVRPETDIIQLGYQNNLDGQYSIELLEIDGISQAELEDTKLNIFHNLSKGAYEFDWNTTDSEERFILHLKATGTQELAEQEAQVYASGGQIYIRQTSPMAFQSVQIFDLAGRVLYSGNLNQDEIQSINLSNVKGAYLVKLMGENISQTEKIIIK